MKPTAKEHLNTRVEPKWKKEVRRDAVELGKSNDIVVNAILRHIFSTTTRNERAKLYRERPFESLRKGAA